MHLFKSLRTKILLAVFVPIAVGLLAAVAITFPAYERVTRELILSRDIELARALANSLSHRLDHYSHDLEHIAAEDELRLMDAAHLETPLGKVQPLRTIFDAGITVYDAQGNSIWPQAGNVFPFSGDFEALRKTLRPVYSDIFEDPASGEDMLLVSAPIVSSAGELVGALSGAASIRYSLLGAAYAEVLEFQAGAEGFAYLVDGNGRVIYHRDAARLGSSLGGTEPVERARRGESGALLTQNERGERVIAAFAPVPGTGWGVVTQENWDQIIAPIQRYNLQRLGIWALAGLISIGLVYFLIARALGPVQQLTTGARRIAEGDFDYTIDAPTGDEIEALAGQFNLMAGALKGSFGELEQRLIEQQQARKKIQEQAQDLALLNALNEAINRGESFQGIVKILEKESRRIFSSLGSSIYLLSDDKKHLVLQNITLPPERIAQIEKLIGMQIPTIQLPLEDGSIYGEVLRSGEPRLVTEAETIQAMIREYIAAVFLSRPKLSKTLQKLVPQIARITGTQGVMLVPLVSEMGGIGLVEESRGEPFSEAEMARYRDMMGPLTAALVRKGMLDALRESEDRYRDLVENSQDLISTQALDGRILSVNPTVARISGYSEDELLQMNVRDLLTPAVLSRFEDYLAEIQAQGSSSGLMTIQTKSGEKRIWEYHNTLRTEGVTTPIMRGMARDVTERLRAEKALRQSEERFRALIENSQDVITLIDAGGNYVYDSPAVRRVMGYAPEERIGRSFSEFIHPDERQTFEERFEAFTQQPGAVGTSRGRFRHKDGSWRWIEGIRTNLTADPVIRAVVVNYRDVTGRVRAEQALRESEARYRTLAEAAPDTVYIIDHDDRVQYVNTYAAQQLGTTPEQIVGRPRADLFPPEIAEEQARSLRRVFESGQPFFTEAPIRFGEQEVWQSVWLVPLRDEPGTVTAVMGVSRDITERVRAEAELLKLRKAVDSSGEVVFMTDRDGLINFVNPAFTHLYGYSAAEVIGQTTPRILKSGVIEPEDYEAFWKTLLNKQLVRGEHVNKTKDGRLLAIEGSASPVLDERGNITGFLAVQRDATERKQRERERETILSVASALRIAATRAEMLPVILDQILDLVDVPGASLAMCDPSTGETVIELGRGLWVSMTGQRIPPREGISGQVIASGQPYYSEDVRQDEHFYLPDLVAGLHAVACVPLSAQERTIGVLWVGRRTAIAEAEIRLLTAIADMAANAIQRASLHEQTEQRLRRLTALIAIDRAITNSLDLHLILDILLKQVVSQLDVHAASVLLMVPHSQTLEYAAGHGFTSPKIKHSQVRVGQGIAGQAAYKRETIHIPNLAEPQAYRVPTKLVRAENFVSCYAAPLVSKGQVVGVLEIFHRAPLSSDPEWLSLLQALATQAAIAIDNATLFESLQRSNVSLNVAYDATLEGWGRALELRDKETEGHTRRVTDLTLRLARVIGMSDSDIVHMRRGALLHDIGKMGVPDSILHKPGPLTPEEWAIMKLHPQLAYGLLSPIEYLRPALDIPYCHHEKWDGSGYPHGLSGEQIPLAARVFAVVDVWDALSSDRPYRKAWPEAKVLEHIRKQRGKHFDPQVVDAFLDM